MQYKQLTVLLTLVLALSGCASLMQIPDKSPCTGFVKTNGDCYAQPINPTRGA